MTDEGVTQTTSSAKTASQGQDDCRGRGGAATAHFALDFTKEAEAGGSIEVSKE